MEDLKNIIKYTTKKKNFQIKNLRISHFENSMKYLEDYIVGIKSKSSVGLRLSYLSSWYQWQFLDNYLNNKEVNYNLLAKSTYYAHESNNWDFLLGEKIPTFNAAILFDSAIMHLGQMIYLGWEDLAQNYGDLLIAMLNGKQYKGWIKKSMYPWFMIELFCKWKKKELDKSKLNYPEKLGIYEDALLYWNTPDTSKMEEILRQLCDFHIENCDENVVTDDDGDEFSPEFTNSDYFLFPMEILMLLSIRKRIGLDKNLTFESELLSLLINQLPSNEIKILDDNLVISCFKKLQKDN
jgi:hypothetical protein